MHTDDTLKGLKHYHESRAFSCGTYALYIFLCQKALMLFCSQGAEILATPEIGK